MCLRCVTSRCRASLRRTCRRSLRSRPRPRQQRLQWRSRGTSRTEFLVRGSGFWVQRCSCARYITLNHEPGTRNAFAERKHMSEIKRIGDQLKRAFEGKAWHGPSVSEVLAGVTAEQAAAHPLAGAHSIWEITLHIATWERVGRRRIEESAPIDVS